MGRRPFLISGMVVLAASTAVLGMSDSVVVAFIATAIAGAGTELVAPVIQATVADVLYGGRGEQRCRRIRWRRTAARSRVR